MKGTAEALLLLMVLMLFAFHHWIFGLISLVLFILYGWHELVAYRRSIGWYGKL